MLYIAVVGGSSCSEEEEELSRQVGSEIAKKGGIVVCGGGSGVMEAVSAGARGAGGTVIGILPGDNTREGNSYLSFAVSTGLGEARNVVIARTADAVIAVGGEYGTLSEMALALKMGKPVIGLKSWLLKPPRELRKIIIIANTAAEAVKKAYELAGKINDS